MKCYFRVKFNSAVKGENEIYLCTAKDKKAAIEKFRSSHPEIRESRVRSIIKVY